jgi:hypothetical protein
MIIKIAVYTKNECGLAVCLAASNDVTKIYKRCSKLGTIKFASLFTCD